MIDLSGSNAEAQLADISACKRLKNLNINGCEKIAGELKGGPAAYARHTVYISINFKIATTAHTSTEQTCTAARN